MNKCILRLEKSMEEFFKEKENDHGLDAVRYAIAVWFGSTDPYAAFTEAAKEALRKVPWILCKKKLPEYTGWYEVTGSGAYELSYAFFHQSTDPQWLKSLMHPSNIIAWRPIMSEPYKEEG